MSPHARKAESMRIRVERHVQFSNCAIKKNEFTGTVALGSLPRALTYLSLSNNRLDGAINLDALPDELTHLHLASNALTGIISSSLLPVKLEALNVANNRMEGSVDFAGFPSTLSTLNLLSNHLCGMIDMSRVHHSFALRANSVHGSSSRFLVSGNQRLKSVIFENMSIFRTSEATAFRVR